ncbi:C40 family peptidase [Phocoenobacter skyensis]|uniref:Proteasome lid subunit RPN8/RPN11, contains Jab1/MPN metalloenzyme (JAMM) motif n=1 Tax=Phocoenobacter skyensis TaxID=97481 RepID=A0A1H7ZZ08_9PAST|nr:C40 family peptidase [Pasteurella skyensis]MDP8184416.1 C40 family peptidase [Pasteurella skyensis]QLB22583.1 phage tail protein [Pasteurella skyensis]SEM63690.1 Proteasome lid subunit RPN8/RPN11, contains Jab1/MPN metalloenzyme (JAMM) motif [Pasteurella skyensis]
MNISEKLKAELINYAKQKEPQEMCGFIVSDGNENQFVACENIAIEPTVYFEISPNDYLKASNKGKIVAVVHSHPDGEPTLSIADRQMQHNSGLDWWLVCNDDLQIFPKIPPLIGRSFEYGSSDCYTIARDFYRLSGIDFPDFERADKWWKDTNLYLDNIEKQGFEKLEEGESLQIGDVILVQVGADVPNHAGIYIGEQMILHHSPKRLSKRDLYDGYWLKHTHSIWRYKKWLELDFTVALQDLAINSN